MALPRLYEAMLRRTRWPTRHWVVGSMASEGRPKNRCFFRGFWLISTWFCDFHVEKYGDLGLIYHLQKTNWGFNWGVGCFRHRTWGHWLYYTGEKGRSSKKAISMVCWTISILDWCWVNNATGSKTSGLGLSFCSTAWGKTWNSTNRQDGMLMKIKS